MKKIINENLVLEEQLEDIITYVVEKKDKISALLVFLLNSNLYKDEFDANLISISRESNMLKYIPTRSRMDTDYFDLDVKGVEIRIGRLINKIIDNIKNFFSYNSPNEVHIEEDTIYDFVYRLSIPYNMKQRRIEFVPYGEPQINIKVDDYIVNGVVKYFRSDFIIFKTESKIPKNILNRGSYYSPVELSLKSEKVKQSDVENFVNELISCIKINKSEKDSKLEIVTGEDISYWYDFNNYQSGIGKLGSSCMSEVKPEFFDIYTKNENCSMLILKNKNNKLIGRAILWKTTTGEYFMDRVYTSFDSDENIFYNYAIKNNYIYRTSKTEFFSFMKGSDKLSSYKTTIKVFISNGNLDCYPYVDTLPYLHCIDDYFLLSNSEKIIEFVTDPMILRDLEGGYIQNGKRYSNNN